LAPFWRKALRAVHPEGIPWPASCLYNSLSKIGVFQRHYDLVAEDIARRCPEGRILDVGTGPGWLLLAIRRAAPAAQVFGVDISPAMVARAVKNRDSAGCGDIVLKVAGAESLPFPDEYFDVVVSTGSVHHWKDPTAGINEVHRVLKAGGCALLCDVVRDMPKPVLESVGREFGRLRLALLWLHSFEEPFYSGDEMKALAKGTAFGEGEVRFIGALCCLVLRKAGAAH